MNLPSLLHSRLRLSERGSFFWLNQTVRVAQILASDGKIRG
jgi:hypothetical protein